MTTYVPRLLAAIVLLLLPVSLALVAQTSGRIMPTGTTTVARFDHTATLLPNENVLIVGGMERNGVVAASAELYDPATGRFTTTGHLVSQRGWGTTATLLPTGKVLIAGGASGSWCSPVCHLASAELYDPATRTFRPTGSMTVPRAGAFAVLLRTGNVLMVGGTGTSGTNALAKAELYHVSTGTFSPTGNMRKSNDVLAVVLLKSGKVLTIGSASSTGDTANGGVEEEIAELYDPATGQFTATGTMKMLRTKLGAALLPDGKVLVVGGQIDGARGSRVDATEIYDPATGSFTSGPKMNFKRYKLKKGIISLGNGQILVAGGADHPEVYDPTSNRFLPTTGNNLDGFCFSTATLLGNGEALIVGGYGYRPGDGAVNHAWLYQP